VRKQTAVKITMTEAAGSSRILGGPNTANNQDIKKQFTVEMTIKITFPG